LKYDATFLEIKVLPPPNLEGIVLILGIVGGEIDSLEASCSVSVQILSKLSSLRRDYSSTRVAAVNIEIVEKLAFFFENVVTRSWLIQKLTSLTLNKI